MQIDAWHVLFWFKNLRGNTLNTTGAVGMAFAALPSGRNFSVQGKDGLRRYALDDSIGFVGAVAAGFHRRRWRKLDSLAVAGCSGGVGSSVDYRKTGRRLTQN